MGTNRSQQKTPYQQDGFLIKCRDRNRTDTNLSSQNFMSVPAKSVLCLVLKKYHATVAKKSNEIPAVRELIDMLESLIFAPYAGLTGQAVFIMKCSCNAIVIALTEERCLYYIVKDRRVADEQM